VHDDKLSWKPQIENWWHNSPNHVECCSIIPTAGQHHTNISVFKSVYFALFHSYLTIYIFIPTYIVKSQQNYFTPSTVITLQIKTVRTFKYDKNKTTILYSYCKHKVLNIPVLFKLSVARFMHSLDNSELPTHFDNCFSDISWVHIYQTGFFLAKISFTQNENVSGLAL